MRLCLPEDTTAGKLRALIGDRRQAPPNSGDPWIDEGNARRRIAWLTDSAAALGWSREGVLYACNESVAGMLGHLREALDALEGGDR